MLCAPLNWLAQYTGGDEWMTYTIRIIYENGCTIEDPNRNNYLLREEALKVPEWTLTPYEYVDLMLCNGVDMFCWNSAEDVYLRDVVRTWIHSHGFGHRQTVHNGRKIQFVARLSYL